MASHHVPAVRNLESAPNQLAPAFGRLKYRSAGGRCARHWPPNYYSFVSAGPQRVKA